MTDKEKEMRHKEANVLRMKALLVERPDIAEDAFRMTIQSMTREQIETYVLKELKEIRDVVQTYAPQNNHISLCIIGDHISVHNFSETAEGNLDAWEDIGDGKGIFSCPFRERKDANG